MGADFRWGSEHLEVEGSGRLRAIERDMSDMPDQVPTLAALAPFATGTTRIKNVAHLRLKESDRLAEVARGLRTAGAAVEELADGLVIPGVWAEAEPPELGVCLDSADDHRIAMSFALLGLRRPGISIAEPRVVAKSYPGFWRDFERCFET
jgi:3-phosphoshikimate 1-carboxyvinyltransferase